MADGEKRIKDLSTIYELTTSHYFVVDDGASGGSTKRYEAGSYITVLHCAFGALHNEIDAYEYAWEPNVTYTKGNVVIYPVVGNVINSDPRLYICIVDQATVGRFVDGEWDIMTFYGMCLDIRDDISNEPMELSTQSTTYPINKGDIVYRYVDGDDGNSHFYAKFYRAKEDHPNGVTSFVASDWDEFASLTELLSDCNKQIYSLEEAMTQAFVEGEASGEIATFNDGSNLPLKSLEVAIEPQQSGSGEPSPSNVRPISGWDECKVTRCGVNQWDEEWEVGNINDGSGEDLPQDNVIRSKNYIRVMSGKSYYIKCPTSRISRLFLYTKDKSYITYVPMDNIINNVYTIPNNCEYIRFRTLAAYGTTYNNDISINYPSTDTEYHAYNGSTYTIDLDGTRYGGKLDVVNGVLTVDRAIKLVSECTWYGSGGVFYTDKVVSTIKKDDGRFDHVISSVYETYNIGSTTPLPDGGISVDVSGYVQLRDMRYTVAADFKTAMGSEQLVYELATPQTIQLTPTIIKSLQGANNFFASTGEILDATYVRNANITINDLIRRIEALEG